jgi:hypothetical protein
MCRARWKPTMIPHRREANYISSELGADSIEREDYRIASHFLLPLPVNSARDRKTCLT